MAKKKFNIPNLVPENKMSPLSDPLASSTISKAKPNIPQMPGKQMFGKLKKRLKVK
jgi:hypothetical protein